MANPLNIPECTIEQLATATNNINVIGGSGRRLSVYEPAVVIVTDHADTNTAYDFTDITDKAAQVAYLDKNCVVMTSARHGEPWVRGSSTDVGSQHLIHKPTDTISGMAKTATVIYPDFDYTTFE